MSVGLVKACVPGKNCSVPEKIEFLISMVYTWIPCKGNGSPSQSPTRQPLPAHFFQQGKPQQKTNKMPNPSAGKYIEGARVIIPYIKGLSEQYSHTLAKHKVRVFFKGTSTIKSLLMHPKDPIPDAQKTDIIYHWKYPTNNCTAEYIGETTGPWKKEFQTIEIKPPVPSKTTTSPQNTQK